MLFSSIPFLYYFLPCVVGLYYLLPKKLKNAELLAASLIFYAWGEPVYVLLMAASILTGYVSGLGIKTFGRKLFVPALVIQLGILAYFKYADFFLSNFNAVTGLSVPMLRLALPIGISFYTFQMISYLADVYRGEAQPQRNLWQLALYISMFPQLIAGPIVRYSQIAGQLEQRTLHVENFALGIRRFICGLSKKVLIANGLGELCELFKVSGDKSVLFYWMYAAAFTLHIYFDFSGYSDMAIGLGRIFGFSFPENFNYPYISRSITEFWRRWHMSLGIWFRDYVYIPLGGNRVSKPRWFLNLFIVWMLTGFWHGASWNFIIWGLFFALLLIIEKLGLSRLLKKSKIAAHAYVLLAVMVSFVIFNAADGKEAAHYLAAMFGLKSCGTQALPFLSGECLYYLKSYSRLFLIALPAATPLPGKLLQYICRIPAGEKAVNIMEPFVLLALLLLITAYLIDGSFNPFLYFRF